MEPTFNIRCLGLKHDPYSHDMRKAMFCYNTVEILSKEGRSS